MFLGIIFAVLLYYHCSYIPVPTSTRTKVLLWFHLGSTWVPPGLSPRGSQVEPKWNLTPGYGRIKIDTGHEVVYSELVFFTKISCLKIVSMHSMDKMDTMGRAKWQTIQQAERFEKQNATDKHLESSQSEQFIMSIQSISSIKPSNNQLIHFVINRMMSMLIKEFIAHT